jgi:hypothetical protein
MLTIKKVTHPFHGRPHITTYPSIRELTAEPVNPKKVILMVNVESENSSITFSLTGNSSIVPDEYIVYNHSQESYINQQCYMTTNAVEFNNYYKSKNREVHRVSRVCLGNGSIGSLSMWEPKKVNKFKLEVSPNDMWTYRQVKNCLTVVYFKDNVLKKLIQDASILYQLLCDVGRDINVNTTADIFYTKLQQTEFEKKILNLQKRLETLTLSPQTIRAFHRVRR